MNCAIVTAAGQGIRFGAPKALYPLRTKPLLAWALSRFEQNESIHQIVVTIPKGEQAAPYEKICADQNFRKVTFVIGGETRYESVRNAFFSLSDLDGCVFVHDAARPLLSMELLDRVIAATVVHGAVIPVVPVSETVKEVEGERILRTIPRDKLFLAQTPQGFQAKILEEAYSKVTGINVTDEGMLVEMAGYPVHVVKGERTNIKITEPLDIRIAECYL